MCGHFAPLWTLLDRSIRHVNTGLRCGLAELLVKEGVPVVWDWQATLYAFALSLGFTKFVIGMPDDKARVRIDIPAVTANWN